MLNWNTISDHNSYNTERFTLLKLLEGSTTKPYVDGVGDATIGIGFNLVYNLDPALKVIVGAAHWSQTLENRLAAQIDKSYSSGQSSLLIANLNAVMKDWHDRHDAAVPTTFVFKTDAQIATALDALDDYYDGRIDSWLVGIPESSERAALFSLCWNAPGMLGPKLKAAIDSGDRAEAWYEIRCNSLTSSLPANVKAGIANRRYVEADTFNLYHADARATYAEAVDAGRMLANHHTTLLAYEAAYDPLKAAAVKGVSTITTIDGELQPAIAAVLKKFQLSVDHRIEELLATDTGRTSITGDGTAYDSSRNDDDLLLGDGARNRLTGNAGADVLIGLRGADTLTTGDQLAFAGKTDLHLLTARGAAFSGDMAELRWFWSGSNTVVEADIDGDGHADLHVTLTGRHSLSADDFAL